MEEAQCKQNETNKASAQWRIRESQIFNVTRQFRDIMNRYNQESVLHRERCKKIIVRELEISEYTFTSRFSLKILYVLIF